jgi:MscS family membrane protein
MAFKDMILDAYWYFANNIYVKSFVIFVAFFVGSRLLYFLLENYVKLLTNKTKTSIDDQLLHIISTPISLVFLLVGLRVALITLRIPDQFAFYVFNSIQTIIFIILGNVVLCFISAILKFWGKRWDQNTQGKTDQQFLKTAHKFSKILVFVILLIIVLNVWGVKIGPLLASLGIAGVAVAFAMQSTLGNVFSGISMIMDNSIKVGDEIELDVGVKGIVVDVGFRSTKIRTRNNEFLIVPNSQLASSRIVNFVLPDLSLRIEVPFSVAYGTKVEKLRKIVLADIMKIKGVLKDPVPYLYFKEMGSSGLEFIAYMWVETYQNRYTIRDEATTRIYNELNKAKISIPFPQMDVHVKK